MPKRYRSKQLLRSSRDFSNPRFLLIKGTCAPLDSPGLSFPLVIMSLTQWFARLLLAPAPYDRSSLWFFYAQAVLFDQNDPVPAKGYQVEHFDLFHTESWLSPSSDFLKPFVVALADDSGTHPWGDWRMPTSLSLSLHMYICCRTPAPNRSYSGCCSCNILNILKAGAWGLLRKQNKVQGNKATSPGWNGQWVTEQWLIFNSVFLPPCSSVLQED